MNLAGEVSCGCKINLRLKVTGKRSDGYHEIDSVFVPLAFPSDRVAVYESSPGKISFACDAFPQGDAERNLAVRAAAHYASAAGIVPQWHIVLEKNIPVAAGLGGGSSDAAAVLSLLNRKYQALDDEKMLELSSGLGADVPFFLKNVPQRATGIGEKLEDFALPENMPEVMIVFPGFPVSAKWAYRALKPEYIFPDAGVSASSYQTAFADPENADWENLLRNDLAFAFFEKFPLAGMVKDFLETHGAWTAQISGSGSSLYALFPDSETSSRAAGALRESPMGNKYLRIFSGGREW